MQHIKNIVAQTITVICCLLAFGCTEEDVISTNKKKEVAIQLSVATRAVSETDGKPSAYEARLHTLRIYAFVQGKLAGHTFLTNLTDSIAKCSLPITFYQKNTQQVDFYLVANEAAMKTAGAGVPQQLTPLTTEKELNDFWFTGLSRTPETEGVPMYCKSSMQLTPQDINKSIRLLLQRPFGKFAVFAAKAEGVQSELKITGLTFLATGTRTKNYLMPQDDATLKSVTDITGEIRLAHSQNPITTVVPNSLTLEQKKDPKYYSPIQEIPFYPFENPWGSNTWDSPGDKQGNVLRIDYTFDGNPREGLVYLPPILRNHYYTLCCLMNYDGRIMVECKVADWNLEQEKLQFDYPTYSNPIRPKAKEGNNNLQPPFEQPTIWYNPDPASTEGSYSFEFLMTGPIGQVWTPTLLDNPGKFEYEVYQNEKRVDGSNGYLASPLPYEIRVRATSAENVEQTVQLAIGYTPSWNPQNSSLLLINGLTNDTKWKGSSLAEIVVIKQIEQPKTN